MSDGLNIVSQNNKNLSTVLAADSVKSDFQGSDQRKLGEDLIKESLKHAGDSQAQAEKARDYLNAADNLERMAKAVRSQAKRIKENDVKPEDAVKQISEVFGNQVQMPLPKDATPEQLESIADDLEAKAKENRRIADDLLKDSEHKEALSLKLKEQAMLMVKKETGADSLRMKSVTAHNEGLSMVFKKLGIYNVDMQYKEQVAYASRKASEKGLM
jgi:ribosomal protein L17